jgi:putative polyhydroxyalkanoate system protein
MANIHIERRHSLGRDGARGRVERIAVDLKRDLQADYAWQGDTLIFKRSGASGTIRVEDESIVIDVKLGMALGLMKGKIEAGIEHNLDQVLTA